MIAKLLDNLFEGVGPTKCEQNDYDCTPEFDIHVIELLLVGSIIVAVLTLPVSATASILSTAVRDHKRALWVAAIWVVPLVGAIVWFACARRRQQAQTNSAAAQLNVRPQSDRRRPYDRC
ncbi:hypothetical protein B2J88_47345 [Rhodococcus sp. SRB_17]|nr:hypothetical protein [Rhodococcus sp. SRB_17]